MLGRPGDWGVVESVSAPRSLTIRVAGYSASPGAGVARLCDVPASLVERCDHRGRPLPSPPSRRPAPSPVLSPRADCTVVVSKTHWPAWVSLLVLASSASVFAGAALLAGAALGWWGVPLCV